MGLNTATRLESPGVRRWSEHPGLTELVTLTSAKAQRGIFDSAGEAIHDHRIALAVDDIFDLTDQASQPRSREPALEDRQLYPLAVFPADIGDASEPRRPNSFRVGDVVRTVIDIRLPSASRRSPFYAPSGARHTAR